MENNLMHSETPEDRKIALEEAFKRVRPMIEHETNDSVQSRLEKFANRPDNDDLPARDTHDKKDKPLSLDELARHTAELEKKAEEAGIDFKAPISSKDIEEMNKDKDKDNENEKEKEKENDKDKEMTPEKQEQKMKEMFSRVTLPSGLEIHQEGPSWVLVSKDGKERTDVTDVMNTIDKYNRSVDVANEENRMQNEAQSGVDKAVDKHDKDFENKGIDTIHDDKVSSVEHALPLVHDVDGNQVFKPEDIKTVAETAVSFAEEKSTLEKLKDPHAMEQMRNREKENEDKALEREKVLQMYQMQQKSRGGRD